MVPGIRLSSFKTAPIPRSTPLPLGIPPMNTFNIGARLSLATLCLAAGASAQNLSPVQSELDAFRKLAGNDWQVLEDGETGHARMLFGGSTRAPFLPSSDADYFNVARAHLGAAQAMFQVDPATLQESAVQFMPLGLVGSSDKVGVEFKQVLRGVEVRNGWLNVILDMDGQLLAVDNTGLPLLGEAETVPSRSLAQAQDFALRSFAEETGLNGILIGESTLVLEQELSQGKRRASLAWNLVITTPPADEVPTSYRYLVSASGEARVITQENMIHHASAPDVGGTVFGQVTPGDGPDLGTYVTVPLPNIRITSTAGTTFSDASGNFNYPGATGPLKCRFELVGPYADVNPSSGFEVVNVSTLTGAGNTVTLNRFPIEQSTSQMNAFLHINLMREWTRAINPADSNMDFSNFANVNILAQCNAFYSGFATNYYLAGGSCPNTSYSSVVYHEQGHWQNDRYNSGNGADGFGEGNADVFAVYQTDDPIVGRGFFGNQNAGIRNGNNTRQFCGDNNGGCYGEVHVDGEVLLGVLWKVRANLKSTHGTQLGGDIANALHNGWMNGYNQRNIRNIIEFQWLVLDDNNGTLSDGTPNFTEINTAFLAQGFNGRSPASIPGSISLYGQGLGGSNIGSIDSASYPAAGAELAIDLDGFSGSSSATVAISLKQTNVPALGGTLLTSFSQSVVTLPVALAGGAGQATVMVPAGAAGLVGYAQAIAADGSQASGFALSNGMQIQIAQ